ncbi:MAG: hypothetical protein FWF26_00825, partial [Treponema sp.]|nr:hypothetical protein [Treponema sp.]
LQQIFLAAHNQLQANDFSGALTTYASGLEIYQSKYFSSGYGQDAEDVGSSGLKSINDGIRSFNGIIGPFSIAAQAISASQGQTQTTPEDIAAEFAELSPLVEQLVTLRNSFSGILKSFRDEIVVLQGDSEITGDASFLSFASWLLSGPDNQDEGIIGTLERFWRYRMEPADSVLMDYVNTSYNTAYTAILNQNFSDGLSEFEKTSGYLAIALDLVRHWNLFLHDDTRESNIIFGEDIDAELTANFLKCQSMDYALENLVDAGNLGNKGSGLEDVNHTALASWQQGALDSGPAVSREKDIRLSYQEVIDGMDSLLKKMDPEIEAVKNYEQSLANVPGGPGSSQTYLLDARKLITSLNGFFQSRQYNSAVRQYTIAGGDLEKHVNEREKEMNDGNSLIQGVSQEIEGIGTSIARYPTEGLAKLTQMNQSLGDNITSARALVAEYNTENQEFLGQTEISALYKSAQDMLALLLGFQSRSATLMASARTQIDRANALRYEGDRLFQAAQTALTKNDFAGAQSNLTRSQDQYNASYAIQESASLRESVDAKVVKLGADIVRMENEIVVRDVRNMVTSARSSFYSGNLDQAEETLIRAQNRWWTTNSTDQPEVVFWLNLVRGALSIQSGRTIPSTAPLYAEMSQLLSDANQSYNEGVKLLQSNRRQDGLAKFSNAMDKTREIRLIFPLNHDARMLELRIEQQTDPVAFNTNFKQRLNEAIAGTKAKNTESYAELQNLAEINPQYPGIKDILSQAEVDMGRRPPAPDPNALARSTELSKNAQTVINARDTLRYEAAKTWLAEAVTLNPDNAQAQTLADQLNILMHGTGIIVLPSYAMDQYNTALQEFLRGNFLTANSIVEQLLQNPEYRKSTQVQDLKRRIDSVL